MDMGVSILPKAGAFSENRVSKYEGSLGEKPNFGSKLGGIGKECYFQKQEFAKKIIENGKNDLSYGGVFGWERSKSPHFSK